MKPCRLRQIAGLSFLVDQRWNRWERGTGGGLG